MFVGTEYEGPMRMLQATMGDLEKMGLEASDVASVIHEALTVSNPKARYPVVKSMLQNYWIPRWLPKRMFDNALVKRLGLSRR